VGAEPLGLTNCLNFGNPEKPHVAWQLTQAVEGLAEACRGLDVPVVGGNVSLYNEAPAGPILPTPVVGMVGGLPDPAFAGGLAFAQPGDAVALVGAFEPMREGSEVAKLAGSPIRGPLPTVDLAAIAAAHAWVREGVRTGALRSAHDIAEGGVAVALAECAMPLGIGAQVELPQGLDLFAEAPGRAFIVSGPREALELVGGEGEARPPVKVIGTVGGDALRIAGQLDLAVSELTGAWQTGLSKFV
jgi:phosphoribosylformylglycinamidine synthase